MKTIFLSVSIVLCASMFTSCRSDYERAYEAESCYRLAKEGIYSPSDTTRYKNEFESIYRSMSGYEQNTYKRYRNKQKQQEEAFEKMYRADSREIAAMLND